MKLKTYVARNLNEALAQVKKDLGPEAVILSTQSRRTFSLQAGWPRTEVEVKAALDDQSLAGADNSSPGLPADGLPAKTLLHQVQADLQELKELFAGWLQRQGPPAWLTPYKELVALHQELLNKGVANQILQRWLAQVQALLVDGKKPGQTRKSEALALLMDACEVVDPWQVSQTGSRCLAFLGPTGVGKTTTIAKLAVHLAVVAKKSVGLISLDAVRPGGHDQLAIYAKLIGSPFAAVHRPRDLLETISRWQDREIILIDTPGHNPAIPEVQVNWSTLCTEMSHPGCCLVLSATCSEVNVAAAIHGFSSDPLHFAIITKVDESRNISGLFNQLCHHRLPVSHFTTGQRVPEDLEPASRQRLLELLLGDPREIIVRTAASREQYEQVVGA